MVTPPTPASGLMDTEEVVVGEDVLRDVRLPDPVELAVL